MTFHPERLSRNVRQALEFISIKPACSIPACSRPSACPPAPAQSSRVVRLTFEEAFLRLALNHGFSTISANKTPFCSCDRLMLSRFHPSSQQYYCSAEPAKYLKSGGKSLETE